MKISVIIPNYNRASLITETLENIFSQSHQPYEVIVVDDGSTDNSVEVLRGYSDKIKLICQENKGPGAARNAGFAKSTGDFIQFFDSDDLMTRNKFQVQSELLQSNEDIDFVYGPYVMAEKIDNDWKQLDIIMQYFALPKFPLHNLVAEGWCTITQTCLFRRSMLEKAGPWREDLMPHEDREYWYRIGKVSRKHQHENLSCVFYRQHRQQITDAQVQKIARTLDGINACDHILKQMKVDRANMFSRMLCKGIRANYVNYLNRNGHQEIRNSVIDRILCAGYIVKQKLGRIRSGGDWQPFQGGLQGFSKFHDYLQLLRNENMIKTQK